MHMKKPSSEHMLALLTQETNNKSRLANIMLTSIH